MIHTLEEVIRKALDYSLAQLRVSLPGKVVDYDASSQTAKIQPMINSAIDADDGVLVEPFPAIPSVPVCWPAGGGFSVTMPLNAGDTGDLVFADFSIDLWRSTGNQDAPEDLRTHSLAAAKFYPGLHTDNAALTTDPGNMMIGASGGIVTIGDVSANTDFVALSKATVAHIQKLETWCQSLIIATSTGPASPASPFIADTSTIPAKQVKAI